MDRFEPQGACALISGLHGRIDTVIGSKKGKDRAVDRDDDDESELTVSQDAWICGPEGSKTG